MMFAKSTQQPRGEDSTDKRIVLKTLLTFKSITFAKALSGWVSNFSPQGAPAVANKKSTGSVVSMIFFPRASTSATFALSAGTEMA